MTKRPNVLYLMTDQHRADWLGCTGHPVVHTPNIDGLAAHGTNFSRFHVTSPVCMPNRGAIFTGRYPSVNGLRHNGLPLPANAATFVDLLRTAGYSTASIGKSHLQPFGTVPARRADEPHVANAVIPEAIMPDGHDYNLEHPDNYETVGLFDFPTPYYGFHHVRMVTGHGDTCGGHYLQWLRQQTNDWSALRDRQNQLLHNYVCPQAYRTALPEELCPTFYIRDEAKAYLRSRQHEDAPFFAFVSFPDPHHPFTPPGRYWDLYTPDQFTVELPFEAHRNPPPQLLAWRDMFEQGLQPENQQQPFMTSEQALKEAMALTAGMITMIDDAIGDILLTLNDIGEANNTIIIVNADHGDYMGAFSLLLKGPFAHMSVNRVPFIWTDPMLGGGRQADGLTASIDIAPTIIERLGLTPYYGMQGRSFVDQLEGGEAGRDNILIEHEENKVYPGFEKRPNMRHLITDCHRITVYKGLEFGELYDLRDDPNETHNLWDVSTAASVKADMTFRLSQAMLDAIERSPWPKRFA